MRKILMFFALMFLLIGWLWAGELKIAVVDFQRIVLESPEGQKAKAQLENEIMAKRKELDAMKAEVDKLKKELETMGSSLSDSARAEKEEQYRRKLKEFQIALEEAQNTIMKRESEITQTLVTKFLADIQNYAKVNGYTLVFERGGRIIYAAPELDISDNILKIITQASQKPQDSKTKKK
ncbi:MAG: OmpH family outer membrane protein [Thermosulfidibacteraceae bacterium]|jgi:outer membrane protein